MRFLPKTLFSIVCALAITTQALAGGAVVPGHGIPPSAGHSFPRLPSGSVLKAGKAVAGAVIGAKVLKSCVRHVGLCTAGTLGALAVGGTVLATMHKDDPARHGIGGNGGPPLYDPGEPPHKPQPPREPVDPALAMATAIAAGLTEAGFKADQPTIARIGETLRDLHPDGGWRGEIPRYVEIMRDPGRGGRLNVAELSPTLRLEKLTGRTLSRAPDVGDLIDSRGHVYDLMGEGGSHMRLEKLSDSLTKHYNKQGVDTVVVDLNSFSPATRQEVRDLISRQVPRNRNRTLILE